MIKFISLSSGSKQNCFYIESEGSSLLIDAGISYSMLRDFLAGIGRDPHDIGTILITHEHSDHVRGLRSILRNLKIPVFINKKSWMKLGISEGTFYPLEEGKTLKWKDLRIMPFQVPHDAVNTFGFVIRRENRGIFFASDIGSYDPSIAALAKEANLIAVESNYDPEMLSNSVYPKFLRDRIAHSHGHLSNPDAASFIRETAGMFTEQVCFLHMSENNNRLEIIQDGIERDLAPFYGDLQFHIAVRENPIPPIEI
ncbi:MAG: MBL fold metallo-hydrolase [Brevinematales bacterium]|nr:MBL fold metallo-hydrolase [Brevinematales bacterium]